MSVRERRNDVGSGEGEADTISPLVNRGESVKTNFHIIWSSDHLIQMKMSLKCESHRGGHLLYGQ